MIRPINHDQQSLSTKSRPATKMDAPIITDLLDTLQANQANCVGMAANMIGQSVAIIAVSAGPINFPMINPKIISKSGPYDTSEGCLSLPGERQTKRFKTIEVSYQDANFTAHTQPFADFTAQIIQHEIDHCNGILI